jgi:hypothetical protein
MASAILAEMLKTFNITDVLFPRTESEAYIKLKPRKPEDKD